MPTRVELAHRGDSAAVEWVNSFNGVLVGGLPEIFGALDGFSRRPGVADDGVVHRLADTAAAFHDEIGSRTPGVERALERLREGAPVVLLRHQPIAFPYDGVTAQYPLMLEFAERFPSRLTPVALHVLMDTDDAKEPYFRTSRIPMPTARAGIQPTPLRVAVRHTQMAAAELPTAECIESVIVRAEAGDKQLRSFARAVGVALPKDASRLDDARRLAWDAYRHSDSLAGFNGGLLARTTNRAARIDVVFVPYSRILPFMAPLVGELFDDERLIREAYESAIPAAPISRFRLPEARLYWLICARCGRRAPSTDSARSVSCTDCGAVLPYGNPTELCARGALVPRVAVDDLVLPLALPVALSISYVSSADHILPAQRVLAALGNHTPHVLWRPRPIRYSTSEAIAIRLLGRNQHDERASRALWVSLTGRGSLLYGLAEASAIATAAAWREHWRTAPHLATPCRFQAAKERLPDTISRRIERTADALAA